MLSWIDFDTKLGKLLQLIIIAKDGSGIAIGIRSVRIDSVSKFDSLSPN